jgi:molecular chaperone DnaJ
VSGRGGNAGQSDQGAKGLLQQFAETMQAGGKQHAPQEGSWLDGVKKFFEDMKF